MLLQPSCLRPHCLQRWDAKSHSGVGTLIRIHALLSLLGTASFDVQGCQPGSREHLTCWCQLGPKPSPRTHTHAQAHARTFCTSALATFPEASSCLLYNEDSDSGGGEVSRAATSYFTFRPAFHLILVTGVYAAKHIVNIFESNKIGTC